MADPVKFKLKITDEAIIHCPDRRVFDLPFDDLFTNATSWREEATMWRVVAGRVDTPRGQIALRALTALTVQDWSALRDELDELDATKPRTEGEIPPDG